MKLVFCGTPAFAVPTLEAVIEAGHEVALVVTQPDRPVGRAAEVQAPAVKRCAVGRGIAVVQPEKIKNNIEFQAQLEAMKADVILVVAYGRIIPDWMLGLPRYGNINLHGSLLPKYRGAAPIQWAVANGETHTGVTTMVLEAGLDTGPMLLAQVVPIGVEETAEDVFEGLAAVGAALMVRTLAGLEDGSVRPVEQDHTLATLAPILRREDGLVDFSRTAKEIYDRWRGFQPWPGAYTTLRGKKLILNRVGVGQPRGEDVGNVLIDGGRMMVGCGGGTSLVLEEVQMEGKKRMMAAEFLRGYQVKTGERGGRVSEGTGFRAQGAGAGRGKSFVKGRPASAGPTRSAEEAQAKVSPARRVAFEILMLVGAGKGHSDELLHGARVEELSPEDRNLATALVMGVLRWEIALDARVRTLLERPEQALAEPVALALRMGVFQLQHMDRIPVHAALSESVELCRAAGQPYATGMVNAILRKVAASQRPKERIFESVAAFSERLGHPRWLVERWVAAYGRDAAMKICEADQEEPVAGGLFAVEEGLPQMDDGSRLVAEIAAAALPVVDGRAARVWDCCAAPGGKTLMLALRTGEAEVLATDVSAKRLGQMEGRLRRFGYAARVRTAVADASQLSAAEGEFDLILCDVPCTGTGTMARNPEIRVRLEPAELGRQAARQRVILAAALGRLAPGGRLVYSTCSLEPEENERVVEAVVGEEFRQVPVEAMLDRVVGLQVGMGTALRDGVLRTLPGVHGCDGFYAAVVQRAEVANSIPSQVSD